MSKHDEGYELIRKSAQNGYDKAQYFLGLQYFKGERVVMNEEESLRWIQLSSSQGYWKSLDMIGECYYYGRILQKDRKESMRLFENSILENSSIAKFMLSSYYLQDRDEPSNQTKGFEYLKQLSLNFQTRTEKVMCNLGMCYEYGIGVERDYNQSFSWYFRLSNNGYESGQYCLGRCYEEGIGVEVNVVEARRLFELSAQQGNIDSQNRLIEYEEDKKIIKFTNKMKYE